MGTYITYFICYLLLSFYSSLVVEIARDRTVGTGPFILGLLLPVVAPLAFIVVLVENIVRMFGWLLEKIGLLK